MPRRTAIWALPSKYKVSWRRQSPVTKQHSPSSPIWLKDLGKSEDAAASYHKALALRPHYADAYNNLGNVYKDLEQQNHAITQFREAINHNPDHALAHNNLGVALFELGRLEESAASFQKAIAVNSDYAEAHTNLGVALFELGRLEECVASLQTAIDIQPDHADANCNLGGAFMELGQVDEAVYRLEKAIEIKSDLPSAYYNLHALLLNRDDMTPSIQCLEKVVNLEPHESKFSFMLGMLLDFSGRSQEAQIHFKNVENGTNSDRANLDAWRYIKTANEEIPQIMGTSIDTFKLGIEAAENDGLVLEFGVRFGNSIRQIASLVKQEVHGFDSFEGLPDAWNELPKGSYSTRGFIPSVPENVILHKGWFEETLPGFIAKHQAPIRFINIDCDIYKSTKTVLELLAEQIIPGTVIAFDEYIGNTSWREDEFKAFQEAVLKFGWHYEYLCFSFMTKQVAVRII